MTTVLKPALWLLVIIVGLPQLAETVYSPSLPEIARFFSVEENLVQYTLTTYLIGFALGVFFWGNLSDKTGRKPCMLGGFALFIVGCLGCYFSTSIEMMLVFRLIQGFGGGASSVLGQAMTRDAFDGAELGKVYATVGAALSFSPAIGPVLGGIITEYTGWRTIFLVLTLLASFIFVACIVKLPETHPEPSKTKASLFEIALDLIRDKQVWGFTLLVGLTNGVIFAYYAEGSFYLIDMLGLSPKMYGSTFIIIAIAGFSGAMLSKRMLKNHSPQNIIFYGLMVIIAAMFIFTLGMLFLQNHKIAMIALTVSAMVINSFGTAIVAPTSLALSLVNHRKAIGKASSIFGLSYYAVASLVTSGMAYLHNDTLQPMPLYFLTLSVFCLLIYKGLIKK